MDANKKRRLVAAAAGVYRYLRSHDEQRLAMAAVSQKVAAPAVGVASLWSASGRQAAMEMRRLLQLRMIR
jgi:hypothetical protein